MSRPDSPSETAPAAGDRGDFLLYDGACPVCSRYVLWTRMREAHPGIRLLDARGEPALVADLRRAGVEVDDTMVLEVGGERFVGAAAMARIAAAMPRQGLRTRLLAGLTRSERALAPVYPLLVRGRRLLLRLLGRGPISGAPRRPPRP